MEREVKFDAVNNEIIYKVQRFLVLMLILSLFGMEWAKREAFLSLVHM